ncbi:MAG: M24 family metallopeptidase [Acidobacteriaceae bacterium]
MSAASQVPYASAMDFTQNAGEIRQERATKFERVRAWLEGQKLDAVLLRRNENLAWVTAGAMDRRVLLPSDTGVAALLVCRDGRRFFLAANNEAERLRDEDLRGLEFEPLIAPWSAPTKARDIKRLVGSDRVAADLPGMLRRAADLAALRAPLTETEVARYAWLGSHTAAVVADVLVHLRPGVTEREMGARVAYALMQRGIEPSVLLMAVDDRIRKYKHALTHTGRLEHLAMINLCARRWGLAVSITRFAYFGKMPQDLRDRFRAAGEVYAALLDATCPGATAAQLYQSAQQAYRAAGFPGEEAQHHQGGATGYREREWLATPGGSETVVEPQAFAWNPSIQDTTVNQGGKVEDTVLLHAGRLQTLTPTPSLPTMSVSAGGATYTVAGVLVRE